MQTTFNTLSNEVVCFLFFPFLLLLIFVGFDFDFALRLGWTRFARTTSSSSSSLRSIVRRNLPPLTSTSCSGSGTSTSEASSPSKRRPSTPNTKREAARSIFVWAKPQTQNAKQRCVLVLPFFEDVKLREIGRKARARTNARTATSTGPAAPTPTQQRNSTINND